jgi:cytochrome c oxidase cbb3-type subunit 2
MSELSAAAAAALGLPEAIVQRSAAARAAETGMSVDEVLEAWAGGGAAPARAAAPAETTTDSPASSGPAGEPAPVEEPAATPTVEEPVIEIPSAGAAPPRLPATVAAMSGRPPVLVGEADNPMAVFVGVVVLFVAIFLVALVGPALPTDDPGARSSELAYSETALRGRQHYQSHGCASCHTQMVRPVVADVDLGVVTLNDSNQVLGTRRFGPDLSDIGSRLTASQMEAIVNGLGGHPVFSLSGEATSDLMAYLLESRTTADTPGEEPAVNEEEPAES